MIERDLSRENMIRASAGRGRGAACRLGRNLLRGPRYRDGGVNYLIPIDSRLASDRDIEDGRISGACDGGNGWREEASPHHAGPPAATIRS